MKLSVKPNELVLVFLSAVILTMTTFFIPSDVDRLLVEKEFPPYLSATVEGRGWPGAFLVDDPAKPNFENIDFQDRFFPKMAFWDLVALFAMVGMAFLGLKLLRVVLEKK